MSGSVLTQFPFIQENSLATPGLWNSVFSQLSQNINEANTSSFLSGGISLSTQGLTINVPSNTTDYIFLNDSTNLRSNYIIGSFNTGTADGLNIYDASGQTMIVSFSKQSVRFYQNVVGPVFDVGGALANTLNAATFGIGTDSKESRIQAAISAASLSNVSRVYVPANMYPYSAASISFSTSVQMVREGGNWAVYDVQAYGANGLNVVSDSSAFEAALSGASAGLGTVYVPSPVSGYKITTTLIVPRNVLMVGASKHGTRLVHSVGTAMMQLTLGSGLQEIWLDGNGSNFSGKGIQIFAGEGKQTVRSCQITDFSEYCVQFVSEAAGSQSLWDDVELWQHTGTADGQEAIVVSGVSTIAANPRTFIGVQTQGLRFMDFGVCNNVQVVGSRIGDSKFTSGSIGVVVTGCRVAGQVGSTWTIFGSDIAFTACHIAPKIVLGAGTAKIAFRGNTYDQPTFTIQSFDPTIVPDNQISAVSFPFVLFSASSTIPDISQGNFFQANNSSPTTITYFANGYDGQQIGLRLDTNTGIAYSSTSIRLNEANSLIAGTMLPNDFIQFVRVSGIWFEQVRSFGNAYWKTNNLNFTLPEIAPQSEVSLGWLRSAASTLALSYGTLDLTRALTSLGTSALTTGTAINPSIVFASEASLGLYRSAASTLATSYGSFVVNPDPGGAEAFRTGGNSKVSGYLRVSGGGNSLQLDERNTPGNSQWILYNQDGSKLIFDKNSAVDYMFLSTTALSPAASSGLTLGTGALPWSGIMVAAGAAIAPRYTYSSESSLGWYRSAASVMALSYGGLGIKAGTNASCGTAVLGSNGSINVANTYVAAGDLIFLTDQTPGGTLGDLELGGIRAGSGFTIQSTSVTDTSTVAWLIIRPN